VKITKRVNKQYPNDFKQEAVALVTYQGCSVVEAAASLNITDKLLYNDRSSCLTRYISLSIVGVYECSMSKWHSG
jgi:hypothetical protein